MPKKNYNYKKKLILFALFLAIFLVLYRFLIINKSFLPRLRSSLSSNQWFFCSKIKNIDCLDENFPCKQEILNIFEQFYDKDLLFLKNSALIDKAKKENPEILKLEINKIYPSTLKVQVTKRKPFAYLTIDQNNYFLVDINGVVYTNQEKKEKKSLEFLLVIMPENFSLTKGLSLENYKPFKKAIDLQTRLKEYLLSFEKIEIKNDGDLRLFLPKEIIAEFSTRKDLKVQVASLQLILKQSKIEEKVISSIDLRFDKPVIKFKN